MADPNARIIFLIGARHKDLLLCEEELRAAGIDTRPSTEDGSWGAVGRVTDVLAPLLADKAGDAPDRVLLRADADDAGRRRFVLASQYVPCQLSVEVGMPCGLGVCMACVIDLADGRRVRCCTDGPVFQAGEVTWK